MNVIGNIKFDIRMQNEQFARDLYARWDSFCAKHIEPVADEVLSRHDNPAEILEISRLELDLNNFDEEDFYLRFPIIFKEKLDEELARRTYYNTIPDFRVNMKKDGISDPDTPVVKKSSVSHYTFEILAYFLLHGTLPPTAENKYKDIRKLFQEVLKNNGAGLKKFLFTYGHYTSLQERLVYQLDDPALEQTIGLLEPGSGEFITSYVKLLRAKYKKIEQPGINESNYRNTVWFVIYAYMLGNQGSWFSRKHFVMQTVLQLAARYNIHYDRLLELITNELEQFVRSLSIPPDLFRILGQLRDEWHEKQLNRSFYNGIKLYKALFTVLRQKIRIGFSKDSHSELIRILSQPDSCRLFLQQLSEKEIIGLTPAVIPAESAFVIVTARSLDIQKNHGAFQGKAGSGFGLIKWQIIFSILLQDRQIAFNRKYFVRNVLQQISAHYNIDWCDLLNYVRNDMHLWEKIDKELARVLDDIHREIADTGHTRNKAIKEEQELIQAVLYNPGQEEPLTPAQQKHLFHKIGDSLFRQKLLDKTTETGRIRLIRLLFPENKNFIINYAEKLELLRDFSHIAGKTTGRFSLIKWNFLLAVLSEIEDKSFNQPYFISCTLRRIAARYNTTYIDLLSYFRQDDANTQLPYYLNKWLDELYRQETGYRQQEPAVQGEKQERTLPVSGFSADEPFSLLLAKDKSGKEKELAEKLLSQTGFMLYAQPLFRLIPAIQDFYTGEMKKKLPDEQLVEFLLNLSAVYKTLSLADMMTRFMEWLHKLIPSVQRPAFYRKMDDLSDKHPLLSAVIHKNNAYFFKDKPIHNPQKREKMETNENVHVHNAGLVLISPFFPNLYVMLDLIEGRAFKNREAQVKAIYAIQYTVFEQTDFPEHELALNKILTGLDINEAIPASTGLTDEEKKTIMSMIEGAKNNWPKMKNSRTETIKQTFLQREGKLEEMETYYQLTVEEKPYDLLLDNVPWNFRLIKHPWMKKMIQVKWR